MGEYAWGETYTGDIPKGEVEVAPQQSPRFVEVLWLDSWSETASLEKKAADVMKSVPRRELGYVIKDNATEIVLVGGTIEWSRISGDEDTYSNTRIIPQGCVVSVRECCYK